MIAKNYHEEIENYVSFNLTTSAGEAIGQSNIFTVDRLIVTLLIVRT